MFLFGKGLIIKHIKSLADKENNRFPPLLPRLSPVTP